MIIKKIITRVRAVMLDTALQPYTDIADLFIVDPDGYIIRLLIVVFIIIFLIIIINSTIISTNITIIKNTDIADIFIIVTILSVSFSSPMHKNQQDYMKFCYIVRYSFILADYATFVSRAAMLKSNL